MDFFSAQDSARRTTRRLVLWFSLAVLTLVLLTNMLILAMLHGADRQGRAIPYGEQEFTIISLIVIGIIVLGTLYKIIQLRGGGRTVAEAMGGTLVVSGGGDFRRQRLLNVVEEMAIASGTPVPPVYVIEGEPAINAFAAGYEPGDAVVAVTSGTLERLNREELQGVIAHEFSHILNGDMRLNIRLIGILHGILVIGIIGEYLLRGQRYRSSRKGGGGVALLGLGLMAIGYGGTFFGNIIKAAVSREREYLADASAVQFTRNPGSIAGALKQIGASSYGSLVQAPGAAEISHAWFSEGVSGWLHSLFATHPPLEDRIRRVEPRWNGDFGEARRITEEDVAEEAVQADATAQRFTTAVAAATVLAQTGQPGAAHLQYARDLLQALPEQIAALVHEPHGARAVIFALVLDPRDAGQRERQLQFIREHGDRGVPEALAIAAGLLEGLDRRARLPLVNIAMGTLRQLSPEQYQLFRTNLNALVEMDGKVALFEWSLRKIVFHGLDRAFGLRRPQRVQHRDFSALREDCRRLLSLIVHASPQNGISVAQAFAAAAQVLELEMEPLPKQGLSLRETDAALDHLGGLSAFRKSQLLKACAAAVTADRVIATDEAELLRAVAEILDCPLPPLQVTAD